MPIRGGGVHPIAFGWKAAINPTEFSMAASDPKPPLSLLGVNGCTRLKMDKLSVIRNVKQFGQFPDLNLCDP